MPQILERKTLDRPEVLSYPLKEHRPPTDRRRSMRFVRWMGWLLVAVVVAGVGWMTWSTLTADDTAPVVADRTTDLLIRSTSGYGETATIVGDTSVIPTVGMWDYVRSIEEKDHAWVAAAEHAGYSVQGLWISADGLTWEHIDGRVQTVSTPGGEPATVFFGATAPAADLTQTSVLPTVGMWDYVRTLEEKDHAWVAAAEHAGYSVQGLWISADGLTWEHIDGRVQTVANPQR